MFYLWLLPVNAQYRPLELSFWRRANRWLDYSQWRITTDSPAQSWGEGREDDVVRHEDCLFETVPHIPPSQSAEQVKCGRESLSDSSPLLKQTAGGAAANP